MTITSIKIIQFPNFFFFWERMIIDFTSPPFLSTTTNCFPSISCFLTKCIRMNSSNQLSAKPVSNRQVKIWKIKKWDVHFLAKILNYNLMYLDYHNLLFLYSFQQWIYFTVSHDRMGWRAYILSNTHAHKINFYNHV